MDKQYIDEFSEIREAMRDLTSRMDQMELQFRSENIWTDYFNPNNQLDMGLEAQLFDNSYHMYHADLMINGMSYNLSWLDEQSMKHLIEKVTKIENVVGLDMNNTMSDIMCRMEDFKNQAERVVGEILDLASRVESTDIGSKDILLENS